MCGVLEIYCRSNGMFAISEFLDVCDFVVLGLFWYVGSLELLGFGMLGLWGVCDCFLLWLLLTSWQSQDPKFQTSPNSKISIVRLGIPTPYPLDFYGDLRSNKSKKLIDQSQVFAMGTSRQHKSQVLRPQRNCHNSTLKRSFLTLSNDFVSKISRGIILEGSRCQFICY